MSLQAKVEAGKLRRGLTERAQRMERLCAAVESIGRETEFEPLLARTVESAVTLAGGEYGVAGIVVETTDGPAISTTAVYALPGRATVVDQAAIAVLGDLVLRRRQAFRVDRYGDLNDAVGSAIAGHALIGVPVWRGDQLIGFIAAGAPPPRRFDDQDAETLTLLARHTAIAIRNALVLQAERRRAVRMAIINRISRLIAGSLSLTQILQTAVEAIHEQLGYASVMVMLVDPDDPGALTMGARDGLYGRGPIGHYRQSIEEGIIGAAARTRQPILTEDVGRDARYVPIPGATTIRAELAVPVVAGDRLLGVLNIESEQPIAGDDAADLEAVADQLAVAIENARVFAMTHGALQATQLLYETSRRISTALDIEDVVQAYLEQVAARGRYACSVALYEHDEAGERTAVIVRGRWTPEEGMVRRQERHPYARDALDVPLDAGQTIAIADVHTDPRVSPELRRIQCESNRPALALIPLMVRRERVGLVVLAHAQIYDWQDADLHPYQATAAQLATAIDSRQQQILLSDHAQQLAVLSERQRLARDLHDSVTQLVFGVTLIAQTLSAAWRRDPSEGERRVGRMLELSQSALAELRAVLTELRPGDERAPQSPAIASGMAGSARVRWQGLPAALRRYAAEVAHEGLRFEFETRGYVPQRPGHEEALYRIAQEALNNVAKHARARHVLVKLSTSGAWTRLTIRDDGSGAGPPLSITEEPPSPGRSGLGLKTMRERAAGIGGTAKVVATSGRGTAVKVVVPRKDERKL